MTTEPSTAIPQPTGIPPHVKQAIILVKLLLITKDTLLKLTNMASEMQQAVRNAIEVNDRQSGQVTMALLDEKLSEFKTEIIEAVALYAANSIATKLAPQDEAREEEGLEQRVGHDKDRHRIYYYSVPGSSQSCWHVPKGWAFPAKTMRFIGWDLWVNGMKGNEVVGSNGSLTLAPICPFRLFDPKFLPFKKLKDIFKTQWKPVFSMMQEAINPTALHSNLLPHELASTYQLGTEHLKQRASYIWELPRSKPETWVVSNWAKHLL